MTPERKHELLEQARYDRANSGKVAVPADELIELLNSIPEQAAAAAPIPPDVQT
jgi:type II secretory pathway component PulL